MPFTIEGYQEEPEDTVPHDPTPGITSIPISEGIHEYPAQLQLIEAISKSPGP